MKFKIKTEIRRKKISKPAPVVAGAVPLLQEPDEPRLEELHTAQPVPEQVLHEGGAVPGGPGEGVLLVPEPPVPEPPVPAPAPPTPGPREEEAWPQPPTRGAGPCS